MIHKSSPSKAWRARSKYRLIGSVCRTCKSKYYPSIAICPKCQETGKIETFEFSGKGKILTYSVVRVGPSGFEQFVPYPIAIVQLVEGPKVSAQIVDYNGELHTGLKVEAAFRKLFEAGREGVIHYGIKFRPVLNRDF